MSGLRITKFEAQNDGSRPYFTARLCANGDKPVQVHSRFGAWACEPADDGSFRFVKPEIAVLLSRKAKRAIRNTQSRAA